MKHDRRGAWWAPARMMRQMGKTQSEIGRHFGVSQTAVGFALRTMEAEASAGEMGGVEQWRACREADKAVVRAGLKAGLDVDRIASAAKLDRVRVHLLAFDIKREMRGQE